MSDIMLGVLDRSAQSPGEDQLRESVDSHDDDHASSQLDMVAEPEPIHGATPEPDWLRGAKEKLGGCESMANTMADSSPGLETEFRLQMKCIAATRQLIDDLDASHIPITIMEHEAEFKRLMKQQGPKDITGHADPIWVNNFFSQHVRALSNCPSLVCVQPSPRLKAR